MLLFQRWDLEIELGDYLRVNSLIEGSYRILRDPLNNLVIGLPLKFKDIILRKYNLRRLLYELGKNYSQKVLK